MFSEKHQKIHNYFNTYRFNFIQVSVKLYVKESAQELLPAYLFLPPLHMLLFYGLKVQVKLQVHQTFHIYVSGWRAQCEITQGTSQVNVTQGVLHLLWTDVTAYHVQGFSLHYLTLNSQHNFILVIFRLIINVSVA